LTWWFTHGVCCAPLDETLDPRLVAGLMKVVEPHLNEMLGFGAYGLAQVRAAH
jgi:hypothetical protein